MRVGLIQLGRGNGAANTTFHMARGLAPHCTVAGIYLADANQLKALWQADPLGPAVRYFPTYNGYPAFALATLKRAYRPVAQAIDYDNLDVLIDTHPGPWAGFIKNALHSTPLLADIVHDPEPHPDRWVLRTQLKRRLLPSEASVLMTLSDDSAERLAELRPESTIIASRHGANGAREYSDDELAERVVQVDKLRHRFLFFGRIEAYKGVETLVDAFATAKAANPKLELTIAGAGPLDPDAAARATSLGATVLNRFIEESEMHDLLGSHGSLVLPYLSATQSGPASLAIANAMPAIATRTGGLPEQIRDGSNGLIVTPGDATELAAAMRRVAEEDGLAASMAQAAHDLLVSDYSWNTIGARLVSDLEAHLTESTTRV